jgi:excisionase family DNA binding protein
MTINWDAEPLTLTVEDVCRIRRLSRNTVYDLIRMHELPHDHYGRAIRIDREALRRGAQPQHIHTPDPASIPIPGRSSLTAPRREQHTRAAGR